MALTNREVQFLQKLKAEGIPKEDALARLSAARATMAQEPSLEQRLISRGASPEEAKQIAETRQVEPKEVDIPGFKKGVKEVVTGVQEAFTKEPEERTVQTTGIDPIVGAIKGPLSTLSGAAELAQRTAGVEEEDIKKLPESLTEAKGGFQKAGKFIEQVGEFAGPLGVATKATAGSNLALKVLAQGGTAGLTTAVQEGEVGADAAVSAIIGGAFPVAGAGLKKLFKPLIDKGRLVRKATGISSKLKTNVDDIAQSQIKVGGKTQKAYESIDDFFIEEGFFKQGAKTSRDDIVQHAQDLLTKTKASKAGLVQGIKTKIPIKRIPNYRKILNELDEGFKVLGQEKTFQRIQSLKKSTSKSISASDLEFLRSSADDLLFSATDRPKQEGLRRVIGKFRDILQDVETSGAVKKANVKIRILSELLGVGKKGAGPLQAAAEQGAKGSIVVDLVGGAGAGIIGGAVPVAGPVLGPALGLAGAAEAITAAPPVASGMINFLAQNAGKQITPELIQTLVKSTLLESAQQITD
jgi:hypothetical protein